MYGYTNVMIIPLTLNQSTLSIFLTMFHCIFEPKKALAIGMHNKVPTRGACLVIHLLSFWYTRAKGINKQGVEGILRPAVIPMCPRHTRPGCILLT